MIFKTAYKYGKRKSSPCGSKVVPEYGVYVENPTAVPEDQIKRFGIVSKRNVYSEIQKGRDATDIGNILKRHSMGDPSAIPHQQSTGDIDVSSYPTDIIGMYKIIKSAKQTYNGLDSSEKNKFGSFEHFLSNFDAKISVPKKEESN